MRVLRRVVAALILAGFVSAQGAVWVAAHHAALEDDSACAAIDGPQFVGPHHQGGPQFEDTDLPSPIEHCAICHMQRAVSGARLARVIATYTDPHVIPAPAELAPVLSLVVVRGSSPRGPPSFFA